MTAIIKQHLLSRYPGDFHRTVAVREFVERICLRHIELGLSDSNFESNLCSGDDARYWQRLSEALLSNELLEGALDLRPSRKGPDFLIQHEGRNIWIEVICPEPTGVPADWLESSSGRATSLPHEAILLRWTVRSIAGLTGTGSRASGLKNCRFVPFSFNLLYDCGLSVYALNYVELLLSGVLERRTH